MSYFDGSNKDRFSPNMGKRAAYRENLSSGFLNRSEINRAVQPQKMAMAGGLKFRK